MEIVNAKKIIVVSESKRNPNRFQIIVHPSSGGKPFTRHAHKQADGSYMQKIDNKVTVYKVV